MEEAIADGNGKICCLIDNDIKMTYDCLARIALEKRKAKFCWQIEDKEMQSECLSGLGL